MKTLGLAIVCILVLMAWHDAHALTLKPGQVLSEGKVYDYASPTQLENIKKVGKKSGIHGRSIYINVEGNLTFIQLNEFRNKSDSQIEAIVMSHVLADIVDIPVAEIKEALAVVDNNIERLVEEVVAEVERLDISAELRKNLNYDELRRIAKDNAELTEEIKKETQTLFEELMASNVLSEAQRQAIIDLGITAKDLYSATHYENVLVNIGKVATDGSHYGKKQNKIYELQDELGIERNK